MQELSKLNEEIGAIHTELADVDKAILEHGLPVAEKVEAELETELDEVQK